MKLLNTLQDLFPNASLTQIEDFNFIFKKYRKIFGITNRLQADLFLSQIRVEVGSSMRNRRENMNYSCKSLKRTFKFYRKNPTSARRDGRCQGHRADKKRIANNAYRNRLGNFKKNDGWDFRGGGFIQLTGRGNYEKITSTINTVLGINITTQEIQQKISETQMGLLTALAYWYQRGIYKCGTPKCCTKKVNRYTDTYTLRKKYFLLLQSL